MKTPDVSRLFSDHSSPLHANHPLVDLIHKRRNNQIAWALISSLIMLLAVLVWVGRTTIL
ncbi:hypothetical protein [Nitrincola sp. MINF-07-Sa-05]|uniref:hypothetical protein n=1 Tax=Nitrincola salilacus TaxID=3400273 RepID=UPI0039182831